MAHLAVLLSASLLAQLRPSLAYPALGEYTPVSDVQELSQLALDVQAFMDSLRTYNDDKAKGIYLDGGGRACKAPGSPYRLQDIARADLAAGNFSVLPGGGAQGGWWDAWLLEGLEGRGRFAGLSETRRAVALRYGVRGLTLYAASMRLAAAVKQASASSASRADGGAPHLWDEAWALYRGADTTGTGSPWYKTSEYDADFPDGLSVRRTVAGHFNKGLAALRSPTYSAPAAQEALDTIFLLWSLSPLRAGLKYLQMAERVFTEKALIEGFASYIHIDAWLAAKNKSAASALRQALLPNLTSVPNGTFCATKQAVEASLMGLGLDCALLGSYSKANVSGVVCPTSCTAPAADALPVGGSAVAAVAGEPAADLNCSVGIESSAASPALAAPAWPAVLVAASAFLAGCGTAFSSEIL